MTRHYRPTKRRVILWVLTFTLLMASFMSAAATQAAPLPTVAAAPATAPAANPAPAAGRGVGPGRDCPPVGRVANASANR